MNSAFIKKISLICLILPSICLAQKNYSDSAFGMAKLHGFYVGASSVITSTTMSNKLKFDPFDVENANLYNRNQYGSNSQVQPGFLVGYKYMIKGCWLVGGEFQANFLKSYINLSGSDYISNVVTANNQYAFQLRGGFNLTKNDNTIYGLVGVALTQANVKIIFDNTNTTVGALGDLQISTLDSKRNLTGLKLGVGYEKNLAKHLSLRVDYSHIIYGTIKNSLIDSTFSDIMDPLGNSTIKMHSDMLGMALIFAV
ncbi:MAG: outer membrane protein [Gammaproteobacteria bacterium]